MNNLIVLGNPWISLSLKLWIKVITQNNLKEAVKVLRWCVYDSDFVPTRWDTRYKEWMSQDLTAYCTFLHRRLGKSFQTLKEQSGLNKDDCF